MGTIAEDRTLGEIAREGFGAKAPLWEQIGDDWKRDWENSASDVREAVLAHAVNIIKSACMFESNPTINEFARDLINRINPGSLPDSNSGDPNGE